MNKCLMFSRILPVYDERGRALDGVGRIYVREFGIPDGEEESDLLEQTAEYAIIESVPPIGENPPPMTWALHHCTDPRTSVEYEDLPAAMLACDRRWLKEQIA